MAGELIAGRYRIESELGRGASASVYQAYDEILERPVALKVISSALAADPDFTGRFEREARMAARLDHPNIVTVHDVGTMPDGRAFIAMRLLEGEGLDSIITRRAPMPQSEVATVIEQLASALDYTHQHGLVHRDVKPSNVRIDAAGRATLTDFGIARVIDSARVTLPGLTIGTPRYMSPEQVRGEDTTAATDVYALAVIAYEMLAGRPPFEGDGTGLMFKIVHEEAASPTSYNPRIPPSAVPVLQRGLAKAVSQRWPTAGQFAAALSTALSAAAMTQLFPASEAPTVVAGAAAAPPPLPEPETFLAPAAVVVPEEVAAPLTATALAPAVDLPPAAPPPPVLPPEPPPVALVPVPEPELEEKKGGRKGVLVVAGLAIALIGAAAVIVLFAAGGGDSKAKGGADSTPTKSAGQIGAIVGSPYTPTPAPGDTPAAGDTPASGDTPAAGDTPGSTLAAATATTKSGSGGVVATVAPTATPRPGSTATPVPAATATATPVPPTSTPEPPTATPTPANVVQLKFLGFWAATANDYQPAGGTYFPVPSGATLQGSGTSSTCGVNGIYGFSHSDQAAYSGGTLTVNYQWNGGGVGQWTVNADPTWYGFRVTGGGLLPAGNYGLTIWVEGSSSRLGGSIYITGC